MFKLVNMTQQTVMAAMLLGAIAVVGPARVASGETAQLARVGSMPPGQVLAQNSSTQAAPSATPGQQTPNRRTRDTRSPTERVEAHIKALHEQLHITDAQAAQWNDLAQVMRDNAKTIEDLVKQREQNIKTMTAVDDLRSYQALAEAHAEGLKKLVPVFETLYDGMSDDQKKIADVVFRRSQRRPPPRTPAKTN